MVTSKHVIMLSLGTVHVDEQVDTGPDEISKYAKPVDVKSISTQKFRRPSTFKRDVLPRRFKSPRNCVEASCNPFNISVHIFKRDSRHASITLMATRVFFGLTNILIASCQRSTFGHPFHVEFETNASRVPLLLVKASHPGSTQSA